MSQLQITPPAPQDVSNYWQALEMTVQSGLSLARVRTRSVLVERVASTLENSPFILADRQETCLDLHRRVADDAAEVCVLKTHILDLARATRDTGRSRRSCPDLRIVTLSARGEEQAMLSRAGSGAHLAIEVVPEAHVRTILKKTGTMNRMPVAIGSVRQATPSVSDEPSIGSGWCDRVVSLKPPTDDARPLCMPNLSTHPSRSAPASFVS